VKLLRYGPRGKERPGLLDAQGRIRDLAAHLDDIDGRALSPGRLAALRRLDPATLPLVRGARRLGVPVTGIGKIVAVGLNYRAFADTGLTLPEEPLLFLKATSALAGPNDAIRLPPGSLKTDWEVELALVIGRTARQVPVARAHTHIAGYCIAHDVSERSFQFERGPTWDKGKSCDGFCPLGPWLVTADELGTAHDRDLWLRVNDVTMQASNTADMRFTCAEIVACASRYMTLHPGDVILTGTPPGSGFMRRPPHFLAAGDRIELGIAGLGVQRQRVVSGDR
jgi:2-keto-4-pentenoate hydratase/2-oxohepta-3-ene-1,7-dioic acid hydratase in catechol pathway